MEKQHHTEDAPKQETTTNMPMVDVTDFEDEDVDDVEFTGLNTDTQSLIATKPYHDGEGLEMCPPPYNEINRSGKGMNAPMITKQPSDYLIGAILVTLFCCAPIGVVAIIRAMTVRVHHARGNDFGAVDASKSARRFIILSFLVGLVILIIGYAALFMEVKFFMNIMLQQKCLQNVVGDTAIPAEIMSC